MREGGTEGGRKGTLRRVRDASQGRGFAPFECFAKPQDCTVEDCRASHILQEDGDFCHDPTSAGREDIEVDKTDRG